MQRGFPFEDWINPSLHLNSSTPNSQSPHVQFPEAPATQVSTSDSPMFPLFCDATACGPSRLPAFHPHSAHPGAPSLSPKPRPLTDSPGEPRLCFLLFQFYFKDWCEMPGPKVRHRLSHHPKRLPLFPFSVSAICYNALRNLRLHLYSWSEHPPKTSQHISC